MDDLEEKELKVLELQRSIELCSKLYKSGSYQEAIKILLKCDEIIKYLSTKSCLLSVNTNKKLGRCYLKINQYTRSLIFLEKALKELDEMLGPDHELSGGIHKSLAFCFEKIGDWESAQRSIERAIVIKKSFLKSDNISFFTLYSKLANYCYNLKDYSTGLLHLKTGINLATTLKLHEKILILSLSNLGTFYEKKGEIEEALKTFTKACEMARTYQTENVDELCDMAICFYKSGSLFLKMDKSMKAQNLLEKSYEFACRAEEKMGDLFYYLLCNLITTYYNNNEIEKAKKLNEILIQKFKTVDGGKNFFYGMAVNFEASLAAKNGEKQKAKTLFEESHKLLSGSQQIFSSTLDEIKLSIRLYT